MIRKKKTEPDEKKAAEEKVTARLKAVFDQLPRQIEVLLFSGKDRDEVFTQASRQVVKAASDLSKKIVFTELDLGHELATRYQVTEAPTILIDPSTVNIRWLGAPIGHETESFFLALHLVGHRRSGLSDQALQVLSEITEPRHIKLFVSLTCPYCPQQVKNGLQAAVEKPELISLEIIDVQAKPALAEKYKAYGTPTVFANEQLIAQGAQPEELFMASLKKLEQETIFIPDNKAEQIETDLVIVGGGPAGLAAGIYGARSGLKSVVVEKGPLGGQVSTTPIVENYPGIAQAGGKTLVDIMVAHALEYANIFPGEEVMDITPATPIVVTTNRRRFLTRAVLLATGAIYRRLGVPGEERLFGRGVSYCSTCDGPLFKGHSAIIVGGGDTAVTEALHLNQIGVQVTLIHRRNVLRAQARLTESLKSQNIPVLLETEVREIQGTEKVEEVTLLNHPTGETIKKEVSAVFVAVGYDPAVQLARRIGIELTPDGYIKKDARHRTNIPGIYSAGDVEGGYKQIVIAAGQGAEAALAIFEDLANPYWTGDKHRLTPAGQAGESSST
ncbi:MAG TPA: FAD-dependent oxidoreductase [Thermodesulfobacteriota bacterium]|nr:FAD-dependent oxidoreductase [Thermodesulfobacteriota bacterium]